MILNKSAPAVNLVSPAVWTFILSIISMCVAVLDCVWKVFCTISTLGRSHTSQSFTSYSYFWIL